MRITRGMMIDTTLANIQRNQERTSLLQSQLTSGSRITKPSDDPTGAAHALSFQEGLDTTEQYLTNIDQAKSWLNTTDSALDAVTTRLDTLTCFRQSCARLQCPRLLIRRRPTRLNRPSPRPSFKNSAPAQITV